MGKILAAASGTGYGEDCSGVGKRSTLGWRGGRALSSQLGDTTPSPASGPRPACTRNTTDTPYGSMKYFSLKVLKHPIANKKRVHLKGQNEINLGDTGVILFSLLLLWFSLYGSQIYLLS